MSEDLIRQQTPKTLTTGQIKREADAVVDLTQEDGAPPSKRLCTAKQGNGMQCSQIPQHDGWDRTYVQFEPITICIRNNINEYGGGGVCLKEMLANADDARATRFTVILDKSQYPTDGLLAASMQSMQLAALLVANDAIFSQQDFDGYTKKIGDSSKASDKHTVGSFGKGAMTAYSLSDTIQLLSGDDIMYLDPHASILCGQAPSLRGNLVKDAELLADAPHQLDPFLSVTAACPALPTLTAGSHYPGTLFRLALRTAEAAQTSKISSEAIDPNLFLSGTLQEFMDAAPSMLLFTRSVKTISVFVKEAADSTVELLHECTATSEDMPGSDSTGPICKQLVTVRIQHASSTAFTKQVWAVATDTASAGGTDGVAAALHTGPASATAAQFSLPSIAGKVYATMPLPFDVVALPVHVNGAFWVQSDRRKLWCGEGDRGKGAENDKVLIEHVAPAWADLIEGICSITCSMTVSSPGEVYRLWPPASTALHPRELHSVTAATVSCLIKNDSRVLWSAAADQADASRQGRWVTFREACFIIGSPRKLLINVGRRAGLQVVELPEGILQAVRQAATANGKPMTTFTPAVLRAALRQAGNVVKPEEVSEVLLYAIRDQRVADLDKLHLILLRDGSVQQLRYGPAPTGQAHAKEKRYFMWRTNKFRGLYQLMQDNEHEQVEMSPAWRDIAKLTYKPAGAAHEVFLLEGGVMNVQVPTEADLANSLPASWKTAAGPKPDKLWQWDFWTMAVKLHWQQVPAPLTDVFLVPLAGDLLSTVAKCTEAAALRTGHIPWPASMAARQATAKNPNAEVLAAVGCCCISDARADIVSPLAPDKEGVTSALTATAAIKSMPLQQLVSLQHLGADTFRGVCVILAALDRDKCDQRVQMTLKQCTVFEDINGAPVDLANRPDIRLLPNELWEKQVASLHELLPWTIIKYHTTTVTQLRILYRAGVQSSQMDNFLNDDLLPEIYSSASLELQPLLLTALDSMAGSAGLRLKQPLKVFVNGKLHRVNTLVDSSSELMKALFAKGRGYAGYELLPDEYAKGTRLAALRLQGLAHDDVPDHRCFLACADQFVRLYEDKDRSPSMSKHSRMLLEMLQRNVDSYQLAAKGGWEEAVNLICTKPIFVKAAVVAPYEPTPGPVLVSLEDSEDYSHHRLVASAVPVTEPTLGDTTQLRVKLGLPSGPQAMHVVTHLLHTATARMTTLHTEQSPAPLHKLIADDVEAAYSHIFGEVSQLLSKGESRELAKLTKRLIEAPWVMVQNPQRFVAPCDLVFDIEEDSEHAIQLPAVLLKLLKDKPSVRKWMTDKLQVTDLHHRAPLVKQQHKDQVCCALTARQYLAGSFNNPDAYPDAVVSVGSKHIHLHKLVVTKGCEVLAKRWGPLWGSGSDPLVLDGLLCCQECSIQASHSTALMFFEFFYTWQVTWPNNEADLGSALELLFMASVYDVPYLVCEAEVALSCRVSMENCCKVLEAADHHAAQQLRKFCLHYIANAYKHVSKADGFQSLSQELLEEVQKAKVALQHSAT